MSGHCANLGTVLVKTADYSETTQMPSSIGDGPLCVNVPSTSHMELGEPDFALWNPIFIKRVSFRKTGHVPLGQTY